MLRYAGLYLTDGTALDGTTMYHTVIPPAWHNRPTAAPHAPAQSSHQTGWYCAGSSDLGTQSCSTHMSMAKRTTKHAQGGEAYDTRSLLCSLSSPPVNGLGRCAKATKVCFHEEQILLYGPQANATLISLNRLLAKVRDPFDSTLQLRAALRPSVLLGQPGTSYRYLPLAVNAKLGGGNSSLLVHTTQVGACILRLPSSRSQKSCSYPAEMCGLGLVQWLCRSPTE